MASLTLAAGRRAFRPLTAILTVLAMVAGIIGTGQLVRANQANAIAVAVPQPWTKITVPTTQNLQSVAADPSSHLVVAVGAGGTIIVSHDGGATFHTAAPVTGQALNAVQTFPFCSASNVPCAWAAGA